MKVILKRNLIYLTISSTNQNSAEHSISRQRYVSAVAVSLNLGHILCSENSLNLRQYYVLNGQLVVIMRMRKLGLNMNLREHYNAS